MTLINHEMDRSASTVFRRCQIKRRSATTGLYETDWFDITDYVKNWGTFKRAVDDVRLNKFTHTGVTLTMRNDTGAFNREDDISSLWNGYLTRYRTLFRIQAGYEQDDGTELPTDTTLGVFMMADEIPLDSHTNNAVLQCRSLVSVFDEVRATDIPGLGATQTGSDIIAKIRDHTDGSSNFIFRQFITSTAWTIQATTNNYNLATSTTLQGKTCWELMSQIAEAEGYLLLINRTGGFEFRDRNERTSTVQFAFTGQGFPRPTIIKMQNFKEAVNKYFNFFRLQFREDDTTTSFVTAGTTTIVDPSNPSWKYGAQIYEFSNDFFATSTVAQTVVNNLFTQFATVKNEADILARFAPQIEISDKVTISYRSYDFSEATLFDVAEFDVDDFSREGDVFDLNDDEYKVLAVQTDLNNFTTQLLLREI